MQDKNHAVKPDPGPWPWHARSLEDVCNELSVSRSTGLTHEEASKRLAAVGPNALPEATKHSLVRVFFRQFQSPLIYLLLIAALGASLLGEGRDAIVIAAVVVLNAVIGAFQEGRAERSMAALRQISSTKAQVVRDGKAQVISARFLVPGDIMLLTSGDAISADARVIEGAKFEVAEAALTGESVPVQKRSEAIGMGASLADRTNMVYAGTHVTSGRGVAVVVATGQHSEVGQIAELTQSAKEPKTPLEIRIAQFGRYLIYGAVALFLAVMALGRWRQMPFAEIFMVGVSQVVSMIPEGLPVAVTVALAVGVQRMAGRKTIIRRLSAVETLGSTNVICSDKTGTLTRNEMTVTSIYLPQGRMIEVTGLGYSPQGELLENDQVISVDGNPQLKQLLYAGLHCNDAQLIHSEEGSTTDVNHPPSKESSEVFAEPSLLKSEGWKPIGDPTEVALLTLALKGGLDIRAERAKAPRTSEIPFDSDTKLMATQHSLNRDSVVFIKGAPEVILDLCFSKGTSKNKSFDSISSDFYKAKIASEQMASQALRVLALAQVTHAPPSVSTLAMLEGKAQFLGLIGQLDPPRAEVRDAVLECESAGIRPVMVTGDHKITGWAIARTLGIAKDQNTAIDGSELAQMTDEELKARLHEVSVFARVHPAQKLRIVEAFQSQSAVVAMTGDGVNDAPALARANVGVAMGITGTEVAKEASKIIVTDDNFATIVKAVEEGRLIYRNIKKLILYLFSTSISEILVLLTALGFGYPLPLVAVQILWINLVTDGALTITLIMEPIEGDEMQQSPIPLNEPLLTMPLLKRMALMTPAIALSTLGYFIFQLSTGIELAQARTEAFTVLAVSQWFNVLNCRSEYQSVSQLSLLRNKWLMGGLVAGNLLQAMVVYLKPLNTLFHTVPIPLMEIPIIALVSSLVLWVEEVRKIFARWHKAQKR